MGKISDYMSKMDSILTEMIECSCGFTAFILYSNQCCAAAGITDISGNGLVPSSVYIHLK